jgi:DNA-binding MarR family transcriptional regulator
MECDSVDETLAEWDREWPELDTSAKKVLSRIGRISDQLDRQFKATLAAHDLSLYAFKLMAALRRSGPPYRLTPTELSRRLLVASGTLTNQIDQLEDAGWVARVPDPGDRRVVLVELTPEGRRKIDAALRAHAAAERAAIAPLTEQEQVTLVPILRKLLASLEDDGDRR